MWTYMALILCNISTWAVSRNYTLKELGLPKINFIETIAQNSSKRLWIILAKNLWESSYYLIHHNNMWNIFILDVENIPQNVVSHTKHWYGYD